MNASNAKDYLPLVQALTDGKVVQYKWEDGKWRDGEDLSFESEIERYRIKPEPREIWVVVGPFDDNFTREAAENLAEKYPGSLVSRYREVVE